MKEKTYSLNKKFGAAGISRLEFEFIFSKCSIDMDKIPDNKMRKLMRCAESQFRNKYPTIADDLFAVWSYKKPQSTLLLDHRQLFEEYKKILKYYAIKFGGELWNH